MVLSFRKAALISAIFSLFVPSAAGAAVILGEASISGQYVPKTTYTDNSSPVAIDEAETVSGTSNTVLGIVRVNGTDDGQFSLGSFGQKAFDHESRFTFSDTIVNTGAAAASFTMNFLISAGALETFTYEIPPREGSDPSLQAGYSITISTGAGTLFESAATLVMEGDYPTSWDTTAILSKSGVDLGGALTHPQTGAPDRWMYAWANYAGSIDLGILAPGESITLSYEARTFVTAGVDKCANSDCAARASIGDPFNVLPDVDNDARSSIGGPDTISSTPVVVEVPAPGAAVLLMLGVLGLALWPRTGGQATPR